MRGSVQLPPMRLLTRLRCLPGLCLPAALAATPSADMAAAVDGLRRQTSYSWTVSQADYVGDVQTVEGPQGRFRLRTSRTQPQVEGSRKADGFIVTRSTMPDGPAITVVRNVDGTALAATPDGWLGRGEIVEAVRRHPDETALFDGARYPRRIWFLVALIALTAEPPEKELSRLLDGATAWRRTPNGEIAGELSKAAALEVVTGRPALGTDEENPVVNASVYLDIQHGMLRGYRLEAQGPVMIPRLGVPRRVQIERTTTFNYSGRSDLQVPEEARRKLAL